MLDVDVVRDFGGFRLEAAFTAATGSVTALFGRSGSGKTTLVNLIAGLDRPDRGRVVLDGTVLARKGPARTDAATFVPPHLRRIGYVFQESRLFPHLTVRANLLYGRFFAPRGAAGESLSRIVDLLEIGHLLDRRPRNLSGGERQRVAIGRALLAAPRLLLLDEPLASLDHARKAEILPYLERLRDGLRLPMVYVSHQLDEVVRLATDLVLLNGGRVAAAGPVADVMARPDLFPLLGRFEAGGILRATVESHDAVWGLTRLSTAGGHLSLPMLDMPVGSGLRLRVRARDVLLAVAPPVGLSARGDLVGSIAGIAGEGPVVDVAVAIGPSGADRLLARVTRLSIAELGLAPGRPVHVVIKAAALERHSIQADAGD